MRAERGKRLHIFFFFLCRSICRSVGGGEETRLNKKQILHAAASSAPEGLERLVNRGGRGGGVPSAVPAQRDTEKVAPAGGAWAGGE